MQKWKALFVKFEKPLIIGSGALLLTAFLMYIEFNLLESGLYDFRMRMGVQPAPSSDVALIAVDDTTAAQLDEFMPLPLSAHAQMAEKLESFQPKAVGYLVDMNRVASANPEDLRTEWAPRFVAVSSRLEAQGIPFIMGTPFDVNGEVVPPYPLSTVPHAVSVIHKDGNVFGEDKITRRALVSLYGKPAFHLELAQRLGWIGQHERVRGQFEETAVEADYFFFRYHGPTGFGPGPFKKTDYPVYSFIDVMNGKVGAAELTGKTILVGSLSRDDSNDFAFTPFSKRGFTNPKLVVHATILDSIKHQNGLMRAPRTLNWIITFLVTSFVIWSVLTYTPLYGVFNTIALALGFMLVGQVLFSVRGLWIRESQPLVGIFLSYYLAVPYRLIQEYKRRWDYQRKNELLVQVEELKTNFLRLVTHDLKTPVARIQGLTETVLRKAKARLEPSETENLRHVVHSTEELNHFITSILELTKIESNRVTLNVESKDVNRLVEDAVERFRSQAEASNIRIEAELEPLFPIRLDASLIGKVISNLVDNALKYSPTGSTIRITTREIEDRVEISVADQGIGMSTEELASLFTRFYRAKNDKTSQVAGTGLGLYLTKFFAEAHQGSVEVESVEGQGSVFRIFLPTRLDAKPGLKVSLATHAGAARERT